MFGDLILLSYTLESIGIYVRCREVTCYFCNCLWQNSLIFKMSQAHHVTSGNVLKEKRKKK